MKCFFLEVSCPFDAFIEDCLCDLLTVCGFNCKILCDWSLGHVHCRFCSGLKKKKNSVSQTVLPKPLQSMPLLVPWLTLILCGNFVTSLSNVTNNSIFLECILFIYYSWYCYLLLRWWHVVIWIKSMKSVHMFVIFYVDTTYFS